MIHRLNMCIDIVMAAVSLYYNIINRTLNFAAVMSQFNFQEIIH